MVTSLPPGSQETLLPPSPLRTGRAPFNASQLKHPKGPMKDPVLYGEDLHDSDVAPHHLSEGASVTLAFVRVDS